MNMIMGYEEKFVKDLVAGDIKVAVSGIIIGRDESGMLMIDDGSGCMPVEIETNVEEGSFVKVFGFLVWDGKNVIMKGNVIKDLSDIDRKIYDGVKKLMNKKA